MAYHFSANQYEDKYCPKKLGNWEYPKWYPERPRQRTKTTRIIADDNGRLLDGIKRENPWGHYVGTWDLPKRITREYAEKLVAPPERLVNLWEIKKKCAPKQQPPEVAKQVTDEARGGNAEDIQEQQETKSLDSSLEDVEVCGETLHCPKCNNEFCLCEDKCRCLVHH